MENIKVDSKKVIKQLWEKITNKIAENESLLNEMKEMRFYEDFVLEKRGGQMLEYLERMQRVSQVNIETIDIELNDGCRRLSGGYFKDDFLSIDEQSNEFQFIVFWTKIEVIEHSGESNAYFIRSQHPSYKLGGYDRTPSEYYEFCILKDLLSHFNRGTR